MSLYIELIQYPHLKEKKNLFAYFDLFFNERRNASRLTPLATWFTKFLCQVTGGIGQQSLFYAPRSIPFLFSYFFRDSSFHSLSQPLTNPIDLFFYLFRMVILYIHWREMLSSCLFFFPFLDVLSLISVIIYLYIYIMFSKGAGKEVWLFSGNLLANTRATWGQGSFEKKLLWLFLIKVIKWTINGDCGKGRREIQKRMGENWYHSNQFRRKPTVN